MEKRKIAAMVGPIFISIAILLLNLKNWEAVAGSLIMIFSITVGASLILTLLKRFEGKFVESFSAIITILLGVYLFLVYPAVSNYGIQVGSSVKPITDSLIIGAIIGILMFIITLDVYKALCAGASGAYLMETLATLSLYRANAFSGYSSFFIELGKNALMAFSLIASNTIILLIYSILITAGVFVTVGARIGGSIPDKLKKALKILAAILLIVTPLLGFLATIIPSIGATLSSFKFPF